jgi:succinate-semialdehyde dehydrogenase / glutarate-semialdehyde dehydrogenase
MPQVETPESDGIHALSYPRVGLLIDNDCVRDRPSHEIRDSIDATVLVQVPGAGIADLDGALAAAQRGFDVWRHASPAKRAELLRRVATPRERMQLPPGLLGGAATNA